jgi:hypothetical protein
MGWLLDDRGRRRNALTDPILPFGRYSDWSVGEIWRVDRGYVRWLDSQRDVWLESRFPEIATAVAVLLAAGDRRPRAAKPRRAANTTRVAERDTRAAVKTPNKRPSDSTSEEERKHEMILARAAFLAKYLTGGKISPGMCFAFIVINQIADQHDVLDSEREDALIGLSDLADCDDELIIEAAAAVTGFDHGFRVLPTVAHITHYLMVARHAEAEVDDLLKPQPRQKIILRRPGSLVGVRCRVEMSDGWQVGRVLADSRGELEVALDDGRRAVGTPQGDDFERL